MILDFNTSDEYDMYGEYFILKRLQSPPFTIKSPRQDIKDLASTLIWFLGGSFKSQNLIQSIMIEERNITIKEQNVNPFAFLLKFLIKN